MEGRPESVERGEGERVRESYREREDGGEGAGVVDKEFERVGCLSVKTGIRRISFRYQNHPHFPSGVRA